MRVLTPKGSPRCRLTAPPKSAILNSVKSAVTEDHAPFFRPLVSARRQIRLRVHGLASIAALSLWWPQRRAHAASIRVPGSMRILFVTGIFPPDRGGPASYVPKVAAALVRRGH